MFVSLDAHDVRDHGWEFAARAMRKAQIVANLGIVTLILNVGNRNRVALFNQLCKICLARFIYCWVRAASKTTFF